MGIKLEVPIEMISFLVFPLCNVCKLDNLNLHNCLILPLELIDVFDFAKVVELHALTSYNLS